jgi:hypothetical protein
VAEPTDDELGQAVGKILVDDFFDGTAWSRMHDLERQLAMRVGRHLYDMGRQAAGVEVVALARVTRPLSAGIGSWSVWVKLSLTGVPRVGDGLWLAGRACVVGSVAWRAEEPPTVSIEFADATDAELAEIAHLLDGDAPWTAS